MLAEALAYAEAGWRVFPCQYQGKSPVTPKGFYDASSDPEQIQKWWSTSAKWPHNLGIPVPQGVVVVDCDSKETVDMVQHILPPTAITLTPRMGGGKHFWYKLPPGVRLSNQVNLVDGIDLRSEGGYVLVPPSVHPNGNKYQWEKSILDTPLTDCPGWVIEEESKARTPNQPTKGVDPLAVLDGVHEGGRQVALWRYTCYLRRKGLTEQEATILVTQAAESARPPYREKSIPAMVSRAWKKYAPGPDITAVRKIWKVNELIATDHGEIRWFIEGLLPQGFCIFTSDAKLGKSMIMGNLAKAVSNGTKAFGRYSTEKTGVLYCDMEQSEALAKMRWVKIANGEKLSDDLDAVFTWDRIGEGGLEQIDNYLTAHPQTKMVVLDVLANIWPTKDLVSGTAYTKDYAIISKLARLARDHRAAVVGVHHKVKNKGTYDGVMSASGSAGIVAASDTIWSLSRERDQSYGFLSITGRNLEARTIRLSTDGFRWHA